MLQPLWLVFFRECRLDLPRTSGLPSLLNGLVIGQLESFGGMEWLLEVIGLIGLAYCHYRLATWLGLGVIPSSLASWLLALRFGLEQRLFRLRSWAQNLLKFLGLFELRRWWGCKIPLVELMVHFGWKVLQIRSFDGGPSLRFLHRHLPLAFGRLLSALLPAELWDQRRLLLGIPHSCIISHLLKPRVGCKSVVEAMLDDTTWSRTQWNSWHVVAVVSLFPVNH